MLIHTTATWCYPLARRKFLGAFQKESSKGAKGRVDEKDIPVVIGSGDGVKFGKRGNDGIIQRQLVHRTLRHALTERKKDKKEEREEDRISEKRVRLKFFYGLARSPLSCGGAYRGEFFRYTPVLQRGLRVWERNRS